MQILTFLFFFAPTPSFAQPPTCLAPMEMIGTTCKCVSPYQMVGTVCKFIEANHMCDKGDGNKVIASPVSPNLKGTFIDNASKFMEVVNKKLGCCLNRFNPGPGGGASTDPYVKFDCVDNSKEAYSDFNQLWASGDDQLSEGGQMNALLLTNGAGRPVTGFYNLKGGRCDEFSEFAAEGDIQGYKVDPDLKSSQQNLANGGLEKVGGVIPLPRKFPYQELKSRLKKGFPSNKADYLRCPILVRAATVVSCPRNPASPIAKTTYTNGNKIRCSSAQTVQVHIRMEQLYEISGMPKLPTVDTIQDASQVNAISIDRILTEKLGNLCEPKTVSQGPVCVQTP